MQPSQKFWGRSLEVFVQGDYEITFSDTGEVYSVRKPSSFVCVPLCIPLPPLHFSLLPVLPAFLPHFFPLTY